MQTEEDIQSAPPIRLAMWSGPRTLSTALMRSFGSRKDCHVSDEPFYGAYLVTNGAGHPMREAIIADMDCDWHSVARRLCGAIPNRRAIWYQKHMAHHMVGAFGYDDLFSGVGMGAETMRHAFLIRDPAQMVASYAVKRTAIDPQSLGSARQVEFFQRTAERLGTAPPVIDSNDIVENPAGMVQSLCAALGIAYDPAMLHWERGARDTDGIWATHWYDRVRASTGFAASPASPDSDAPHPFPPLPRAYQAVVDICRRDYDYLARYKLLPEADLVRRDC